MPSFAGAGTAARRAALRHLCRRQGRRDILKARLCEKAKRLAQGRAALRWAAELAKQARCGGSRQPVLIINQDDGPLIDPRVHRLHEGGDSSPRTGRIVLLAIFLHHRGRHWSGWPDLCRGGTRPLSARSASALIGRHVCSQCQLHCGEPSPERQLNRCHLRTPVFFSRHLQRLCADGSGQLRPEALAVL